MADYSESAEQNPAANATGKSLARLFATDPLNLSKDDREEIIKAFRKQRTEFVQESKSSKKKKSGGKKRDIGDLGDLDIEI